MLKRLSAEFLGTFILIMFGAGVVALGLYGFVATLQPDAHFGRILAAYGGIFVAGSLAWGRLVDGFRPDRFDYGGSVICLLGVAGSCTRPATRAHPLDLHVDMKV